MCIRDRYQTVFMSRKTKYAVVDNNFTEYRQYTLPQHAGFTANEAVSYTHLLTAHGF